MKRASSKHLVARSGVARAIFTVGVCFSAIAAVFAYRSYDADESRRFSEASNEIRDALETRTRSFESMLLQMAGLYSLAPKISISEFHDYTGYAGLPRNDRGVFTFGIFQRQIQRAGHSKILIQVHEVNAAVPYSTASPGVDISSDATRMAAIERATMTARPTFSDVITGLNSKSGRGYMLAAPAYSGGRIPVTIEERKRNLIGIAYIRFSESGAFDIFQSTAPQRSTIDMEVYTGGLRDQKFESDHRVFDRFTDVSYKEDRFRRTRESEFEISVGGAPFTVRIYTLSDFTTWYGLFASVFIFVIGTSLSFIGYRLLIKRELRDQKIFRDLAERQKYAERARFLGEFSTLLAASLDPQKTAEKIATLLTPAMAQWSAIDLLKSDGSLSRVATSGHGSEADRDLIVRSVPLRSGERSLGAMVLASPRESTVSGDEQSSFFSEVALRASLAIENSRLYFESQELNRAKDNFLAMLSHELRTPMNVILGWLEILSTEEVDDETYAQALETLNRNARMQIQLINELLDVSRIINGKLTVEPKDCDLGEIAEGALESIKPAARAKQITCSLEKSGELKLFADPERVQQIFWNLLSNALKFTPVSGKILVKVAGSSEHLILNVTDSGQGIDPAFLPFVFDRFRQEESTFARQQGGLGLGLSIVRYLAEAHGGSIAVSSEGKGKGTTFTLTLPRLAATEPSPTDPSLN